MALYSIKLSIKASSRSKLEEAHLASFDIHKANNLLHREENDLLVLDIPEFIHFHDSLPLPSIKEVCWSVTAIPIKQYGIFAKDEKTLAKYLKRLFKIDHRVPLNLRVEPVVSNNGYSVSFNSSICNLVRILCKD